MHTTTVLLVDDEAEFVEALAERLTARGLNVESAGDGETALRMSQAKVYDAILLDMAMPGLDGLQTLRGLLEINPDQQVILLTGRATLTQGVEAMKLGALDLLEKPADIATLVARIEKAATRRTSLQDERVQERVSDILRKKGW
ncbi:MAG: response regulator [Gemmatimonadota bacterium]|nr:response regulator [Gemmatimonadota bacterium]MDH5197044.1 response regulator [Gemmatimonadota bacterium]